MRVERTGDVGKLTPRVERFIREALAGRSIDELQSPEARRADYLCLNGLLAIELKTLEGDASERVDNLLDELRQRPDWPVFLGKAPIGSVLKHLDDPEDVGRRLTERLGRAIKNHLSKADKQLAAHEVAFPRKNLVRLMVLLNEDHEVYEPYLVVYVLHHLLNRTDGERPLYPHVDGVVYLTERHAMQVNGLLSFPVVSVMATAMETAYWKTQILRTFETRWAGWNHVPLFSSEFDRHAFSTIDHVPDQMKRYEHWELEYRRRPYMRSLTKEQVRERFDEIMCIATLAFVIASPFKPPREAIEWSMSSMSHMMIEMAHRAIPVTEFRHDPKRFAAAAARLKFPQVAVAWLSSQTKPTSSSEP